MRAPRCDTVISSRGPCNTPMRERVGAWGSISWTCPRCEARAAGRCWNCGAKRTNNLVSGVYCEPCRQKALRLAWKRAQQSPEHKAKESARWKEKWKDPAFRAMRREKQREWKRNNPEKVKAAWERYKAKRDAAASPVAQTVTLSHHGRCA